MSRIGVRAARIAEIPEIERLVADAVAPLARCLRHGFVETGRRVEDGFDRVRLEAVLP